jgi:cell division protease FtsH
MTNSPQRKRSRADWQFSQFSGLFLVLGFIVVLGYLCTPSSPGTPLPYGELIALLNDPQTSFRDVQVAPARITGVLTRAGGRTIHFVTNRAGLENDPALVPLLHDKVGAALRGAEDGGFKHYFNVVMEPLALVLLVVCLFFLFRMMGERGHSQLQRTKARKHAPGASRCTFAQVAGVEEAVEELREVVDFLKEPDKYRAVGGRIPRGLLLVGPPGTGKTLLAKAVAGEAGVPFFSISGSEFVEMYVGVGAARVRDLFAQTRAHAPCIVFIDELDALGKTRGSRNSTSHDEREQTLNQLLVEMDGFDSDRGILVIAATNRPEMLDPALLRPGRFDRTIVVDRPDINGREAILKVHACQVRLAAGVELRHVAGLTPGCVGADLANIINEAALLAARRGRREILARDLEEAVERGAAGLERKQRVMNLREKERIAYHELGHALVAAALPDTDPVHKISIIPRGVGALGYTLQMPGEDRYLITQSELHRQIQVLLGGILAEELIFHETSTGAQNDLERATRIARSMVKQFGMSRLGRVSYQGQNTSLFLAASGAMAAPSEREYSEQVAHDIDCEVSRLIDEAAEEVRALLAQRRPALDALAKVLMEREVLDGEQFQALLREHLPGPRLVPGSQALAGRRIEGGETVGEEAWGRAKEKAGE